MSIYEILFEGTFATDGMAATDEFSDIEGFFALRHVSAKSLSEAVEQGISDIQQELRSKSNALANKLIGIVVAEFKPIHISGVKAIHGFTLF